MVKKPMETNSQICIFLDFLPLKIQFPGLQRVAGGVAMRLALSQLSGAELGVLSFESQEPWKKSSHWKDTK